MCNLSISTYTIGETLTTGNLLPNANDGVDWGSSQTDMINDGGSGFVTNGSVVNGFTITCPTSQANCGYKYDVGGDFEVTGTATLSVDNIPLTSNSITQQMLDNGITLNSKIDVANCESVQGNCENKTGNDDSHTTTVDLKDNTGNILSTVSQTRTTITGFQGSCNGYPGVSGDGRSIGCGQYTDTIIYNDIGSNKVDWSWSGTDSHGSTSSRGGPNLLGASLNMTYSNTEYNPIDNNIEEEINNIIVEYENLPPITELPIFEDITWVDNFIFTDEIIENDFTIISVDNFEELETFENFEELEIAEEFEAIFEEEFSDEEMEILEEEFADEFDELTNETMDDVVEDEPTEMVETETKEESFTESKNEEKEIAEAKEEEKEIKGENNETIAEEKTETKKTKGLLEEEKEIEVTKTDDKKISIDLIDNVSVELKEISLFDDGSKLSAYDNTDFYQPENIYTNVDNTLFIQADLSIYNKGIYLNIGLDNYISTDPVGQHEKKIYDLKVQKLSIMIELQKLKDLL
jgi:hypothetical protein